MGKARAIGVVWILGVAVVSGAGGPATAMAQEAAGGAAANAFDAQAMAALGAGVAMGLAVLGGELVVERVLARDERRAVRDRAVVARAAGLDERVEERRNLRVVTEVLVEPDLTLEGFPKFFTPNGDGVNDFWQFILPDSGINPIRQLFIFDRYGNLLAQVDPQSAGWDGTFNGSALPEGDYYYVVKCGDGSETASGGVRIIRKY